MQRLSIILIALAACGGKPVATQTPAGGGTDGTGNVGTMALHNASKYDIYSIQLSPSDQVAWGANLIEGDVLMHGEDAQLAVFDCKKYDLRMIDDENVECVIDDIDLCFEDKKWTINDSVLTACATGWAD
ncbi:MAG: hypothetical protein H0T65_22075 [Deltaproteobacteria bacterium]|nr:hypothetical protein [Deltaproteobacteria bacterium]